MTKLAGTLFVMDGIKYDYPFVEAIRALKKVVEEVFVICIETEDGTSQIIQEMNDNGEITALYQPKNFWDSQAHLGSERISVFTNFLIEYCWHSGWEWVLNIQADEIISESANPHIWSAINSNSNEAFMLRRINLWGSSETHLENPPNGLPCSNYVIRLAKSNYRCVGDGESINAMVDDSFLVGDIFHMGFVRDRAIMVDKVFNMQRNVFQVDPDKKLEGMKKFNPWAWHSCIDVRRAPELPEDIVLWAKLRKS